MFHLLVSYNGWKEGADTIPTGRIYIKADERPGSEMLTAGKLDTAKVSMVPALLVSETTGTGSQKARVAYINGLTQNARDTTIRYLVDTTIPGVANSALEDFAGQLGITKTMLTHTHWRVCDADLFRVLLLIQQDNAAVAKPGGATVFSTAGIQDQEEDLVSVMMPFGREFDPVLNALRVAAKGLNLRCVRADDIWIHHHVIQDIVDLIAKAKVVICDCSGRNPNVFYEIGIAHSLGKDVILITRAADDIPFDLRHLRYVSYLPNSEGLDLLTKAVEGRLRTLTA
ncbi:MAG: hypothetical protein KJ025_06155 [Burkholderiales bacterium]|nr:hypothetical protein [Burkholderiales bacterium]